MGVFVPSTKAQWSAHTDPREAVSFGVRAERTGFDSLWATDSLLTPRLEALTVLAALAAVTDRVTLGTGALLPALRTPVQAAQTIASVDLLSGGRLVLGVGAGFPGRFGQPVYAMVGTPWPRRFRRLDETVELWRRLWTGEGPVSYHGEVLHFDDIAPGTRTFRPGGPPVWLGGATPAALARAGRLYDGWLPYPPDPAAYGQGLAAIRTAAGEAGRGEAPITPALFVNTLITGAADGGRAALDTYARANYGLPVEEMEKIQAVAAGTPEAVVEQLGRYVAEGARHLVLRVAVLDIPAQAAQLDRLVALRPALNALLPNLGDGPGTAGVRPDAGGVRPDAGGVRRR
ncbi:LLM class flavin-dependent oxidoreductase [Actinacidiphila paucisporea]|uniref:Flavin-dependent oxidoreductase, luciferase family (Includes alkanesulfonate monooxygenase SsuD and methylene tetrahydromethanopterin reductase) n=1 Tax=Actinacidiphila paucisporea TaxID=310782 RepID=A0A1M7P6C2_9ACTN|nr:LLM class flavin-dependent oxidoreductase [Actinacidiphila paucisporea]SHN12154.1 Flavin-dependent oxidoreductase, luciferase family (includes alkanesulfonate monooxygenase SsuD and methylene tetrahydromethanopterin reductase) [Actinacidiphila paucisporea]